MSSITNINNNSSVVNVGRTTPVQPGKQPPERSIPVYVSNENQDAVPVEEQNKIQSEVALSLLGIPRSEVALGIFADVNTYDVNPSEWSSFPLSYVNGYGIKHIPEEAGALVEAPKNKTSVLTSKRFFRYQPGRVSSATFGVKSTVTQSGYTRNPVIRKYGIYDNFDGYYWETRNSGKDDNFSVIRRTQSLYRTPSTPYGVEGQLLRGSEATASDTIDITQLEDYRIVGKAPNTENISTRFIKDRNIIKENRYSLISDTWDKAMTNSTFSTYYNGLTESEKETFKSKCERDLDYWLDMYLMDIEYDSDGHTSFNTRNYETSLAVQNRNAEYEVILYNSLEDVISTDNPSYFDDLSSTVETELISLISITQDFFARVDDDTTYPTLNYSSPTKFGNKTRLDTMFDSRKFYWAYYVNEFDSSGNPLSYTLPPDYPFDEQTIKDKCVRDMIYVIDGYRDDLIGGGNAATTFNASMYYNQNSSNNLTVYSQIEGGLPAEIQRHIHLKDKILADLQDTYFVGSINTNLNNRFFQDGSTSGLANIIINNFSLEYTGNTEHGERGVAGNIVVLRDGLVLVHAALFDTNLLKEQKKIKSIANSSNNRFKLTDGSVTFKQYVKLFTEDGNDINSDLRNGGIYKVKTVYGNKSNEFDLEFEDSGLVIPIPSDATVYFHIVNPFIFPKDYDPTVYNPEGTEYPDDPYPEGMVFPYLYSENGVLPLGENTRSVGFIDTALSTEVPSNATIMKEQIDNINFNPEYINWIKNNVKPEFYGVYEYRVPRSRFSTDKLNGVKTTPGVPTSGNPLVYSDVAVGDEGRVRPGEPVKDETGSQIYTSSEYDFDFTKVTMLKIEFSWYGAVGALFLAYVPIGNGEARWVRVHHLRCSNQLKISSLGNATLPITYTVYGGGDSLALGDGEQTNHGYGNSSHHIVKYGASYYIDGGDRGTVRLYSHNNEELIPAYGRLYDVSGATTGTDSNGFYIDTSGLTGFPDNVFFMGSRIKTSSRKDQTIRVSFVEGDKIYLSRTPSDTGLSTFYLIPDRSNMVYGLETKNQIVSTTGNRVRNRVQVYPTKLSTINLGSDPVRLKLRKTPVFQTDVQPTGTFTIDGEYEIESSNPAIPITSGSNFIGDGESIYGWFRGRIDEIQDITLFGRLYKVGTEYFFELYENESGNVTIRGDFLPDKRFNAIGEVLSGDTKEVSEKEGLSSILISNNEQVPVPNTGSIITTFYVQNGTEQIDLTPYFDYNKDYLSYPLTNISETLYFSVDLDSEVNYASPSSNVDVAIGTTWEEQ